MKEEEIKEALARIEENTLLAKKVLTIKETAKYLGISTSHLYRLTSQKRIPYYKRGKMVYFDKEEIDGWALSSRVKPREEEEEEEICKLLAKGH